MCVFFAGQSNRIDLTVGDGSDDADPSHAVDEIYDVIPSQWKVQPVEGDDLQYNEDGEAKVEKTDDGSAKKVFIDGSVPAGGSETFTYFVEAPESAGETGSYTFGPAKAKSEKDDAGVVSISGTSDTNAVVGRSSETPL